jgi:hypothetical protein
MEILMVEDERKCKKNRSCTYTEKNIAETKIRNDLYSAYEKTSIATAIRFY